ncbi:MAG: uracil-DNA glycosylase [Treponema sp.]|jgi:DNA polymerase|nr:uracil-DNA glycosylase [Treponema sp.]
MTAEDKAKTAQFLDLAFDFLSTGYRSERGEYDFQDDEAQTVINSALKGEVSAINTAETNTIIDIKVPPGSEISINVQSSLISERLERVAEKIRSCNNCPLGSTRTNAVPGEGVFNPVVMVVGEGPGADEDAMGRPFVGRAGQYLDRMIGSIGLSRGSNCFIANVVKCRPPYNREPAPQESAACVHFLREQILLLKPKFILCAGKTAGQTLLRTNDTVTRLRGKFYEFYPGHVEEYETQDKPIPLLVSYHPSALLHSETYKRPAWEDLKMLRAKIESGNGSC